MNAKEFASGFTSALVIYSIYGHSGAGFYVFEDEYPGEGSYYLTRDETAALLTELHTMVPVDDGPGKREPQDKTPTMTVKQFAEWFSRARVVYALGGHMGSGFYISEDGYPENGSVRLSADDVAALLAELHAVVVEDDHFGYPPLTGGE